ELTVELPHDKRPGAIYTIEFSIKRRKETFYAEANAEIGLFQFELESGPAVPEAESVPVASPQQEVENQILCLSANNVQLKIDLDTGKLVSFSKDGKTLLQEVAPCFDRPYTGLDALEDWGWYA